MVGSTWSSSYRNHEEMARHRLALLFAPLPGQVARATTSAPATVFSRRSARIAAGWVGAVGGVVVLVASAASLLVGEPFKALNTGLLAVVLTVVALTYGVARLDARRRLGHALLRLIRLTTDTERDLERLESARPRDYVARASERLRFASIAMPLVAVAMLGPLVVHLVVGIGLGAFQHMQQGTALDIPGLSAQFGWWMALSAVLVTHAHIVLAVTSWRHAKRLVEGNAGAPVRDGMKALGWTVLAAAAPGAVFILLPPLITFATGLVLVLPAFKWAERTLTREHTALVDAGER